MELAKINKSEYALALESPRACDVKKGEIMKSLIDILSKTYFDAGQVMPGYDVQAQTKNLQVLAGALWEELNNFQFIRVQEIRIAFKNGVRGEYGEFFGLNIKTFYQWLKGYQFDEKRKKAYKDKKAELESELPPIMTPEESDKAFRRVIQRNFQNYKAGGPFQVDFSMYVFKKFEEAKLIQLSIEEKNAIFSDAKNQVIAALKIKRLNPRSNNERAEIGKQIHRLENGQMEKSDKLDVRVIACKIAIQRYYDSIEVLNF